MELIDLLAAEKVEEFNEQRGMRTRLDFFAADLPDKKLAGVDLSNANLDKSDLTGSDLSEASLYKTSMMGIDGGGMSLAHALAPMIRLKEAFLEEADLTDADLSKADLKEAVLTGSKASTARMANARLVQADASGASWPDVDLGEASLHQAVFVEADLSRSILTDAAGQGVDFTRARLDAATATRARFQDAIFVEARLMGARFDGADLTGADFTNADLTAVDFTGANLSNAKLEGATLRSAVLADAVLEGVDLSGLDLEDVDLTGVDARALGLSEEQMEGLAAMGAAFDPDVPVVFRDVMVARTADVVAVLWLNVDRPPVTDDEGEVVEEGVRSVRWCVIDGGNGGEPVLGVLPTSGDGVLAQAIVPWEAGFQVLLFVDRPGGMVVVRYPLATDGTVGASESEKLGYTVAVRPVARTEGEGAWFWSMGRSGPSLMVQRLADNGEGLRLSHVHSERVATGRGFLGRHLPVLVCKGGVMMPIGPQGTRPPLRAPDAFALEMAQAAPFEDRVLAVWRERTLDPDRPGGLRTAWLAPRVSPEVEPLTRNDAVIALDVLPAHDGVWVAWIERASTRFVVRTTQLPGEGITELPLDAELVPYDLRFAPRALGSPEAAPALAILTAAGDLVVCDVDTRELGRVVLERSLS